MSIRDELFMLQLEQLKHDQRYHKDICVLPIHQRMNHMALHFAKYSGRIAEYLKDNDAQPLNTIITDIFIISVVSANVLNVRLADYIPHANDDEVSSLLELGRALIDNEEYDYRDSGWLLKAVAIPSGRLAKACESLDHIDAYPYREEMVKHIAQLSAAAIVAAAKREINLERSMMDRLAEAESKLIFHGYV